MSKWYHAKPFHAPQRQIGRSSWGLFDTKTPSCVMCLDSKCAFNDSLPLRKRISFNPLSFLSLSLQMSSFFYCHEIMWRSRNKERSQRGMHQVFLPVICNSLIETEIWRNLQITRTTQHIVGNRLCVWQLFLSLSLSLFTLAFSVVLHLKSAPATMVFTLYHTLYPLFFCLISPNIVRPLTFTIKRLFL